MNMIKDFLREEDGATAIEYALIVGLVAVVIIGALSLLGGEVGNLFTELGKKVKTVSEDVGDISTDGSTGG